MKMAIVDSPPQHSTRYCETRLNSARVIPISDPKMSATTSRNGHQKGSPGDRLETSLLVQRDQFAGRICIAEAPERRTRVAISGPEV